MKKIEKYIGRRFGDITRNLGSYRKARPSESLHRIRVDIKKLKAIINLVSDNKKKFKPHREFKPLREIFRKAGDIRQPEVMFELLLKYGVTGIPKDRLLDSEYKFADEFVETIPSFVQVCKKSKERIVKHARNIDHKSVRKSIGKFEKRLRKALTSKIKFEAIHRTRKLIKQVIYLSEIHDDLKKKKRNFFNSLQELIGVVHDKQMLMIMLRKPANADHQKALNDLATSLEADKKEIIKRCAAFYEVDKIVMV